MVCGDFRLHDWSDGDVVFANSTCFDRDLFLALVLQSHRLRQGALFLSTKVMNDPTHWSSLVCLVRACVSCACTGCVAGHCTRLCVACVCGVRVCVCVCV